MGIWEKPGRAGLGGIRVRVTLEADKLHLERSRHSQGEEDTSWEGQDLQDVPLGIEILAGATFCRICSWLKYPFPWSLVFPLLECHPP